MLTVNGKPRLTFELSRLRRLAKPAVAGRLQRRVRRRRLGTGPGSGKWATAAHLRCRAHVTCPSRGCNHLAPEELISKTGMRCNSFHGVEEVSYSTTS